MSFDLNNIYSFMINYIHFSVSIFSDSGRTLQMVIDEKEDLQVKVYVFNHKILTLIFSCQQYCLIVEFSVGIMRKRLLMIGHLLPNGYFNFKPLAPHYFGFNSHQGLWILKETIQLAYRKSVAPLRCLK
jgi:hypothetical protein